MKPYKMITLAAIMLAATGLRAQSNFTLSTYSIVINGTSNLHAWTEKVEKVSGAGEAKLNADKSLSIQTLKVTVPVTSIVSTEGSIMNNKTYKALKSDKYPEITFVLAEPLPKIPAGSTALSVTANGRLTIASVTKSIAIPVKITLTDNKVVVEGTVLVKMSDYGLEAPTALLGMLKTGDLQTIVFKTNFSVSN